MSLKRLALALVSALVILGSTQLLAAPGTRTAVGASASAQGPLLFARAQEEEETAGAGTSTNPPPASNPQQQEAAAAAACACECDAMEKKLQNQAGEYAALQNKLADTEAAVASTQQAAKEVEGRVQSEKASLETKVASLETKVRDQETAIQAAAQEKQSIQEKHADLENKLKETTSKLAEYTHLYQAAEVKLSAQEKESEQLVCLPPGISQVILSNYAKVKPVIARAVTQTKQHTEQGYRFAVDFSQKSYEKAKPKVVEAAHVAKTHLLFAQEKCLEKMNPAFEKIDEVAKPYYQPVVDKVDEITKPYQPKAKEIFTLVKTKIVELVERTKPLVEALLAKYRNLVETVARKLVMSCSGVPQLAAYIHHGTEDMVVNTLLYTPVVTFAYFCLSSFLSGGSQGGKGKRRKNRKQPHLASPGKPAFKPSGSPFRPTPPKNKRG